jgi:hypothetical protein
MDAIYNTERKIIVAHQLTRRLAVVTSGKRSTEYQQALSPSH